MHMMATESETKYGICKFGKPQPETYQGVSTNRIRW